MEDIYSTRSTSKMATPQPVKANLFGGGPGQDGVDALMIVVCGFIVFTMQSGFALLESGFCSRRSQANIMAKNMVDVALGGIAYWFVGYGFSWGSNTKGSKTMSGESYFILDVNMDSDEGAQYVWYFFQLSFATATATITSGAVAERIKLTSYMVFAMINTAVIYTFCCHWVWHPDGFLYGKVVDFAGSSVVHMCGGASALAGMIILKPRRGRFEKGKEKYFAPSSPTNIVLGTFFLWWGWIGFNCGTQMIISGDKWRLVGRISVVTMNAAMGGAAGAVVLNLLLSPWRKYMLNIGELCASLLGGLVAICASVGTIRPWEGLVIGFLAAFVTIGTEKLLTKLKVDDPVGCFAVHWAAGVWGMIATGFFSKGPTPELSGVFREGTGAVLGWNILCCIIISVWAFGMAAIVFLSLKYTIGLRLSEEDEFIGADEAEHDVREPYKVEEFREDLGRGAGNSGGVAAIANTGMEIEAVM